MDASLSSRGEKNKEKKKKKEDRAKGTASEKAGNRAPSLDAIFPFVQLTLQRSELVTASSGIR